MKPKRRGISEKQAEPTFFSADVSDTRRFYLDLTPSGDQPLAVVCGGVEHCTPNYAVRRTTFPYFSIEYVVGGGGTVDLKGHSHVLSPGRLFAYGPGVPHHITGDPANPLVKYFVDFAGSGALEWMRSCRLPPGRVLDVFPPYVLQPLFDELIENGLRVRRESAELCVKLLECLGLRITGSRAPVEGADTMAFSKYEQCRRYIELHCLRLRTLKQIANECHVNNAYLCRLFRRYDDQSPYQHLLRLKMNFAAGRLQQSGALVKQVAEEAGFNDPYHFSRVFHSILGLSPAAFRRFR